MLAAEGIAMTRRHVGLVFGGRSVEHAVSIASAQSIVDAFDPERTRVSLLAVDPDGRWSLGDGAGSLEEAFSGAEVLLTPVPGRGLLVAEDDSGKTSRLEVDVILPIIHGRGGEDGALQGLLELSGIPYVGSGVLASAIQMDKDISKRLLAGAGLPVVEGLVLEEPREDPARRSEFAAKVEADLGLPVFIKPANSGSSIGIARADDSRELAAAIDDAFRYDTKIVAERAVDAREIEVAVIGNGEYRASLPGEIYSPHRFYDYEAKYLAVETELRIPADLPEEVIESLREIACRACGVLGVEGMARVDFLVARGSGEIFVNELNSLPGFTRGSMFPQLFEASGLAFPALLDKLLDLALERHRRRAELRTASGARAPRGAA
jgi:D-alanine-D-alanine ligase